MGKDIYVPAHSRRHYRGSYAKRAKRLRDQANADPTTACWRCGMRGRDGDPWQAGHVRDGDPSSPLLAEHASCNAKAGRQSMEPRSRVW